MEYKEFIRRVVRYERKKVVLPVLMLIVLISMIGFGSHLRTENVDGEFFDNRQHLGESYSIISMEHEFFNQGIEKSEEERIQRVSETIGRENQDIKNRPALLAGSGSLLFVYKSGLYPLLPGTLFPAFTPGQEGDSILFSRSDGYFLTDTIPKTLAETAYFDYRMEKLENKINNSRENWTLERYRDEVEGIRSIEYPDERIRTYLKNSSATDYPPMGARFDEYKQSVIQNDIKEVRFYHFIPSAIATFLIYYLLSGLFVEVFRITRTKI